ncbi:zinc-binding dehydrogenase [Lentzea sp. E54]|uniref:zinc-binding dehydrogenase n=1 Tax=Lentzea xerophila TaxID=3435883 RepID=UPI003DA58E70
MRAVRVHEFGGPETLRAEEVPEPVTGPGQVLVGLDVADVIFLDTLLRGGWGGEFFPLDPPYVPGGGGAGEVLSVGEGVNRSWLGRRVAGRGSGGYAERMVLSAEEIVPIPDGLGSAEAAAMVHDGVTALSLAHRVRIEEGQWVLVAAATGGAGSLLVQLLRDAGARVAAAARGERKLALSRELGAEVTVDYSLDGWQQQVRDAVGGDGVALAFDGAGGELGRAVFETVAEGGRFVTYGTSGGFADIDPEVADRRQVHVDNVLEAGPPAPETVRELLAEALALVAQGRIRPVIGATYPLAQAERAHRSLEERTTLGKSLLLVQDGGSVSSRRDGAGSAG